MGRIRTKNPWAKPWRRCATRSPSQPSSARPEHITDVVESSLKRLKVDTIDLLYQHPSTSMCRSKTSPAWSGICSRQGRSSISGSRSPACRRSGALTPCSPSRRFRANIRCGGDAPKKEVLPTLEELGIGFVPFSPLGKGFLTGAITENTTFDSTDFRNIVPRFTPETRRANQALVELLGEFAARKQVSPLRLPSPGHSRRSRGSCRSQVPRSSAACKRTSEPLPSN